MSQRMHEGTVPHLPKRGYHCAHLTSIIAVAMHCFVRATKLRLVPAAAGQSQSPCEQVPVRKVGPGQHATLAISNASPSPSSSPSLSSGSLVQLSLPSSNATRPSVTLPSSSPSTGMIHQRVVSQHKAASQQPFLSKAVLQAASIWSPTSHRSKHASMHAWLACSKADASRPTSSGFTAGLHSNGGVHNSAPLQLPDTALWSRSASPEAGADQSTPWRRHASTLPASAAPVAAHRHTRAANGSRQHHTPAPHDEPPSRRQSACAAAESGGALCAGDASAPAGRAAEPGAMSASQGATASEVPGPSDLGSNAPLRGGLTAALAAQAGADVQGQAAAGEPGQPGNRVLHSSQEPAHRSVPERPSSACQQASGTLEASACMEAASRGASGASQPDELSWSFHDELVGRSQSSPALAGSSPPNSRKVVPRMFLPSTLWHHGTALEACIAVKNPTAAQCKWAWDSMSHCHCDSSGLGSTRCSLPNILMQQPGC